ncbi:MAG: glycoside hydrolase [Methylobacterium sp.]
MTARILAALVAALLSVLAFFGFQVQAEDWIPVREVGLEVAAGSPLDVSAILPNRPIDGDHRIVTGAAGRLVYADRPDDPARLMCASLAWSPASGGFPDHADADRYALQLKRHGYDIARFHFVDAALMSGRARDFDFDPETADRIHYLMAALKRNGISWIADGLSSWRGAEGGHDDRWEPTTDLKLAILTDEAAFAHWRRLVERTLAAVNPYTGLAPLGDPALVLVVPVNEGGIEFDSILRERKGTPHYSERLRPGFNAWLNARYGTAEALARAWGSVPSGGRLADGTLAIPQNRYEASVRMRDFQAYLVGVETRGAARMASVLRELGYRGAIAPFNNWPTLQTALSRAGQDAVALNTYQDWVGGYAPGSAIGQLSGLADGAAYMRAIAAGRWLGRPFVVTEYDHLFWSRARYEAGLVVPAYAALQGWDAICRHAHGPIVLAYGEPFPHKRGMLPYAIALDPVARAGETLAALLFRRGDVATARNVVPFAVRGEADLTPSAQARESDVVTRLALVSAIGLGGSGAEAVAIGQPRAEPAAREALAGLHRLGRLAPGQGVDAAGTTYTSDTGEIRLDTRLQRMTVRTARTEAIAFKDLAGTVTLGALTVGRGEGAALFSVSALDDRPVATSRRLLAVFATDARNTDMRFRDAAERVIEDFGHLPVLIRRGALDLALPGTGPWRVSPVGLDGTVRAPVAAGDGAVALRLSNDAPGGPTTYFLIERTDPGVP